MSKWKNFDSFRKKTTRFEHHDYDGGIYFVTFCTRQRELYLGEIVNGEMVLSDIGRYADAQLQCVSELYPYAQIPLWVVMPNHIHAVVVIGDAIGDDAMNRVATGGGVTGGVTEGKNPMIAPVLGTVVRGLKARITRFANQNDLPFAWQSRFHDHIIRDASDMNRIADYITNNVARWDADCFHPSM